MTQQEKETMFLDLNSVLVKFWIEQGRPDKEIKIELLERMLNWYKKMGYVIPDGQSKEPVSEDLEEAAWECVLDSIDVNNPVLLPKYKELLLSLFKAGAEWQKEQDQPITGNSLEQEWLRYIDKEMKENRGELPALGEYGWLMIARHFAEWQKSQMLKDAVEGKVVSFKDGHKDIALPPNSVFAVANRYEEGDKVKIVIIPEKEDKK